MVVKRGHIVYVDFGKSEGCIQGGVRPALVVQNNNGNKNSSTTIVAPITSDLDFYPFHVVLSKDKYRIEHTSKVLLEQLRTINKSQIIKFKDIIDEHDMKRVNKALKISVGL